MKPILELKHLGQSSEKNSVLKDYNLIISEGDIVYVQGLSDSGIYELLNILTGVSLIVEGKLYLYEKQIDRYSDKVAQKNGIYFISSEKDLVNKLSIADNIEAINKVRCIWKLYNKQRAQKITNGYLIAAELPLDSKQLIDKLTDTEKQKISFIKATVHNASLVIVDGTKDDFTWEATRELAELIRRSSSEGTAFLILSRKYSAFAEYANKIQVIHDGRDVMQWHSYTECADILMKCGIGSFIDTDKEEDQISKYFTGLYDFNWEPSKDIWWFLKTLHKKNRIYWDTYIDFVMLKDGVCFDGKTAIVPRTSADQLVESLDIQGNMILTIPTRISRNKLMIINEKLAKKIACKYYELADVEKSCTDIRQLNYLQRKILSVYRWEIAKPKTIVLENPYWGMDIIDIIKFREYLVHLVEKKIKIIYLSNNLKELFIDCEVVLSKDRENHVTILTAK